ncbi:unnamed protein product [Caenorhabditis auriculariae]|uniref:E2F/DP family winged-helix DNA-binding domain-containing protein n=1 Tax=Caenorhabditis auriculariae TaxID=2777116 RepID=A0A8S1H818_9PELO|nr:unnamed protein product [Caenorhabditis auriculariae]
MARNRGVPSQRRPRPSRIFSAASPALPRSLHRLASLFLGESVRACAKSDCRFFGCCSPTGTWNLLNSGHKKTRMTSFGSMLLSLEANKENIPPGGLPNESFVLPESRGQMICDDVDVVTNSPVPRPSPAYSQKSDASFFSSQESLTDSSIVLPGNNDESEDDPEVSSRKEKSLGLLCQRFLIAMNEETCGRPNGEVHLETVARKMNVEKRRIYDIVNVMEALDAMQKTNKSYYKWHGLDDLPKLMAGLQKEAIVERLPERVLRVEQAMCSFTELSGGRKHSREVVGSLVGDLGNESTSSEDVVLPTSSAGSNETRRSRVDSRDRQGRNSLAQLCRRFLMVLLSNPKNIRKVSLDVASTVLIKDPETEGFEPPSRSRCRRLYDIANVLVALGLIKKVHYLFGTKKIPLFVYSGPEPDENAKFDANACVEKVLLTPSTGPPLTPQMKATTAALAQQLTMGKRCNSDVNLSQASSNLKMPRMKSDSIPASSSLMMFAELAAAERLRLDTLTQMSRRLAAINSMTPSTSSVLPPFSMLSASSDNLSTNASPLDSNKFINFESPFSSLHPILLPPNPQPLRPTIDRNPPPFHQSFSAPSIKTENYNRSCSYSMSNILSSSKKSNVLLDHTKNSPFQVVKKSSDQRREKKPFGELQNRM